MKNSDLGNHIYEWGKKIMKNRMVRASLVTLSLVASGMLIATPAQAAQTRTLAADNTLYAFDQYECTTGEFATVNILTSEATLVGANTPTSHTTCSYGAAFDVVSGDAYWVSTNSGDYWLMRADLQTGASTEVGSLGSASRNTIAIDDQGNAYTTGWDFGASVEKLYRVSLTDATTTAIASIPSLNSSNSYGFAFNPADKQFYINFMDDGGLIYRINVETGALTQVCNAGWSPSLYGMSFDSNGVGWTANYGSGELASFDIAQSDCGFQVGATVFLTGHPTWSPAGSAISYPAPPAPSPSELPATGRSAVDAVTAGITALGLVMAGLVATLVVRRRQTRS